ncbi:hypothetical protein RCG17_22200 [Neobacillus sp. PS3-12]|jgi:hypothetical protein|uniref:hypothetical protein n=1 Tax=Neobacillus sp. PS3-12 TaxID=3070677 RepID=UPI0027E14A23|nr:hypothetical protein [Neobacillus sp. PS3-12]WML52088.1 hypothetical protein RCG17_22200 [Neobacillus sp. PS3-12]
MQKGQIIQGNHLIDFLNEIKGYTFWTGNKEIEDLSVIDSSKRYYISRWGSELSIVEMELMESSEQLKEHLLMNFKRPDSK